MKTRYINQANELRKRIPIGLSECLRLLDEMSGDLEKAEKYITETFIKTIIEKTNTTREIAIEYLEKCNFNLEKSIQAIESDYFIINGIFRTEIEYLLLKWGRDKQKAIRLIVHAIRSSNMNNQTTHSTFDKPVKTIIDLSNWIDYVDSEGLSIGILYNKAETIKSLQEIGLSNLAEAITFAKNIHEELYKSNSQSPQAMREAKENIESDSDFREVFSFIENSHDLVINELYGYISRNIEHFRKQNGTTK